MAVYHNEQPMALEDLTVPAPSLLPERRDLIDAAVHKRQGPATVPQVRQGGQQGTGRGQLQ